jgi:hypothetical protein
MILKRTFFPCLLLCSALGGGTGASLYELAADEKSPKLVSNGSYCLNPAYKPIHVRLRPLADLLARGEGNYNSVNRGYAGDTPQGIKGLTGSSFAAYTVGQVMEMQRWRVWAVGRYQLIPRTLRFAVSVSDVTPADKFTNEVQDRLMAALIVHKRPAIGAYLRGEHDYIGRALDDLAREWASVEYRSGRGYYDYMGGNRASISRTEAWNVLQTIKEGWQADLQEVS